MTRSRVTVESIAKRRVLAKGIRMNPVPASSRAGNYRASKSDVDKVANLYERFSGQDAFDVGTVTVPDMPKVVCLIGECDFVGYTTVRDGVEEKYIHKFNKADRALLVVDATGKNLYLIGGRYTFTERGIVDRSDPSN